MLWLTIGSILVQQLVLCRQVEGEFLGAVCFSKMLIFIFNILLDRNRITISDSLRLSDQPSQDRVTYLSWERGLGEDSSRGSRGSQHESGKNSLIKISPAWSNYINLDDSAMNMICVL